MQWISFFHVPFFFFFFAISFDLHVRGFEKWSWCRSGGCYSSRFERFAACKYSEMHFNLFAFIQVQITGFPTVIFSEIVVGVLEVFGHVGWERNFLFKNTSLDVIIWILRWKFKFEIKENFVSHLSEREGGGVNWKFCYPNSSDFFFLFSIIPFPRYSFLWGGCDLIFEVSPLPVPTVNQLLSVTVYHLIFFSSDMNVMMSQYLCFPPPKVWK